MKKSLDLKNDVIKSFKKANRNLQFERNGGGQFVSFNRPHKNLKKYDRKRDKKNFDFDLSLYFFLSHFNTFIIASLIKVLN